MKRRATTTRRSNSRKETARLEDIPNVGPAVAGGLRQLGITMPGELSGRDPYAMYDDLCRITGQRHDPCLLDTFIAAVRYMEGGPKKPWWKYSNRPQPGVSFCGNRPGHRRGFPQHEGHVAGNHGRTDCPPVA